MCTLIALHRCTRDAPLLIAANRDEYLDRPAEGPALRAGGRFPLVAPRDLRAGGTWLGVNSAGLLAAVTNRPVATRDESRRSRGLVVLDALEASCAREAAEAMGGLAPQAYNPFNLLLADGREAFAVIYHAGPEVRALAPGAHVIGNADPDDRRVPKVARLLDRAEALEGRSSKQALDALAAICQSHEGSGGPLQDTCIHADGYGTRSSALLRLGRGAEPALWFAHGPPCRQAYEDFTFLLHEIDRGDRFVDGDSMTRSTA